MILGDRPQVGTSTPLLWSSTPFEATAVLFVNIYVHGVPKHMYAAQIPIMYALLHYGLESLTGYQPEGSRFEILFIFSSFCNFYFVFLSSGTHTYAWATSVETFGSQSNLRLSVPRMPTYTSACPQPAHSSIMRYIRDRTVLLRYRSSYVCLSSASPSSQ